MKRKPLTLEDIEAAAFGQIIELRHVRATVEALDALRSQVAALTAERNAAEAAYDKAHSEGWADCEEAIVRPLASRAEKAEARAGELEAAVELYADPACCDGDLHHEDKCKVGQALRGASGGKWLSEEEVEKVREALLPYVAANAPSEESDLPGGFWRSLAVSKEQEDRATAALALLGKP